MRDDRARRGPFAGELAERFGGSVTMPCKARQSLDASSKLSEARNARFLASLELSLTRHRDGHRRLHRSRARRAVNFRSGLFTSSVISVA